MSAVVAAQSIRAPRTGLALLVAAPTITEADERWLDGFKWEPEVPEGASAIGVVCGGTAARTPTDAAGVEEFEPIMVWASEHCSTKGMAARDWMGRARRALESQQSFLVAEEFWSGAIGNASGNKSLAAHTATTLTAEAVPASVALTYADGALTRKLRNRLGAVHARAELVDAWTAANLLRYEAGQLFTPNQHLVISDGGYTGDGPRSTADGAVQAADASSQWIYATDVPSFRLGSIDTLPGSMADIAEGVDRDTNDVTVWAQRLVGIQWDRHAHFAIEVAQGALV